MFECVPRVKILQWPWYPILPVPPTGFPSGHAPPVCHSTCTVTNVHTTPKRPREPCQPRQPNNVQILQHFRTDFIHTQHLWGVNHVNKHTVMKFESLFRNIQFIFMMIMLCKPWIEFFEQISNKFLFHKPPHFPEFGCGRNFSIKLLFFFFLFSKVRTVFVIFHSFCEVRWTERDNLLFCTYSENRIHRRSTARWADFPTILIDISFITLCQTTWAASLHLSLWYNFDWQGIPFAYTN